MPYATATWRVIRTPPAEGAWNMAVDEAILETMEQEGAKPTLRLYAWNPPCLSLGYAQPVSDVDGARLAAQGWHLVRRPTGGRAILHTDELTYAVIAPHSEPRLAGGVIESYQRLSQALLRALHLLDIPAEAKATHPHAATPTSDGLLNAAAQGPVCFEVPSNYEITVGGKKLVGSAQARRKEGILQHGSLPLVGDLARITQALAFPSEAKRQAAAQRLLQRATSVEAILRHTVTWEEAAQAFTRAFSETLDLELVAGELTPAELKRAEALAAEKYASLEWNNRM
ncbi:MAG: biotin/lipoate A/B protein ligase family protein [Anaerolineales bacterium]|nr:biotin/lipoate A/B protein ligase family protein [Anaerolineales bacterium]